MIDDVGVLIFSQLLGITQYPGSPFTGNIFRDMIMFLIIPTIFIILVVYSMTGRIVADSKLRVMLGVGAYLFIVAGGYYSIFALLAGPYFLFLIIFMGLIYWFFSHFTGSRPKGTGSAPANTYIEGPKSQYPEGGSKIKTLLGIPTLDPTERKYLNDELKKIAYRISRMEEFIKKEKQKAGGGEAGKMADQLMSLVKEQQEIEHRLKFG